MDLDLTHSKFGALEKFYFKPLADGVRHFKETEKGRDAMCESFTKLADKVADEREEQTLINAIKLMKSKRFLGCKRILAIISG